MYWFCVLLYFNYFFFKDLCTQLWPTVSKISIFFISFFFFGSKTNVLTLASFFFIVVNCNELGSWWCETKVYLRIFQKHSHNLDSILPFYCKQLNKINYLWKLLTFNNDIRKLLTRWKRTLIQNNKNDNSLW